MTYKVIGKPNCPYCENAVKLLEEKGLEFEYINAMEDFGALKLLKESGLRSFPQIWKGDDHIGGFDMLVESFK